MSLDSISGFFAAHIIYIYFLYGLAFFTTGLALLVETRINGHYRLAQGTRLLGLFALLHGTHEFIEMFIQMGHDDYGVWVSVVRLLLLVASFATLVGSGIKMLPTEVHQRRGLTMRVVVFSLIGYGVLGTLVAIYYRPDLLTWLQAMDTLARFALGLPGALMAGAGLLRYHTAMIASGVKTLGREFIWAGLALMLYGVVGQAFPPESIIFPSMYINNETFFAWAGFPIELARGMLAVVLAYSVIRALRLLEHENTHRLDRAIETERELQIAARELSLLYEASSLLTANYDLETLMQAAIDRIVRIIDPIDRGLIAVPAEQSGCDIAFYAASGFDKPGEIEEATDRWVAFCVCNCQDSACWYDKDDQNVSTQLSERPIVVHPEQPNGLSLRRAVLPLVAQDRAVGTVLLETAPEGPYLTVLEVPTLVALVRQLAVAIENARLVLQLRQREARRAELLQRATKAQEAERKRIARELHDDTGQALTALALGLRGISRLIERKPEVAAEQVSQLQAISQQSLDELRHLISDLRPSHLDDLGLPAALRWYAEQVQNRGTLDVRLQVQGEPYPLSPEMETTLFRIAQESVGNVIKHAEATEAVIDLSYDSGQVTLCIVDNGQGFDPAEVLKPGAGLAWGLIGIQERVTLAGGTVDIDSDPAHGTRIEVRVPTLLVELQRVDKPEQEEVELT